MWCDPSLVGYSNKCRFPFFSPASFALQKEAVLTTDTATTIQFVFW